MIYWISLNIIAHRRTDEKTWVFLWCTEDLYYKNYSGKHKFFLSVFYFEEFFNFELMFGIIDTE